MSLIEILQEELKTSTKQELMQKYSDELAAIIKEYGGLLSNVPARKDHPFYVIQQKLYLLCSVS